MTEPLVPSDTDLRDFHFMPLDVARLMNSDLVAVASGEEFRAAVLLWCKSWHQVPAASLPTDDRMLAHLAGFGRDLESWRVVKGVALRGFILCDDGRLYHPVIAEKAVEAIEAKRKQRDRTANATKARKQRNPIADDDRDEQRDDDRDDNREDERNVVQGTGTGTGTGTGIASEEGARAEGEDFAKEIQGYLDSRADDLTNWESEFLISIKWEASLSKAQNEKLKGIREKLGPKDGAKPLPSVKRGTPAYDAWIAHYRKKNQGRPSFHEARDSLTVPTEFPPSEVAA
jgi:hypothetical protein